MNVDDLLALRGQPPKVGASDAEAVALALYGLTARATALDGERDRNFRLDTSDGGRFVLKFIDHEADDIVVAGQSAALTHIAEQNLQLRVPRVVRTRTAAELGVVAVGARENRHDPVTCRVRLVTYLPGRLIQDSSLAPPGRNLLWLAGNQIAQLDRALAGFFHPALAQPIAWDVRRAPSLLPVIPQVQTAAVRRLLSNALEPIQQLLVQLRGLRSQAIHGDCHGRNLIVNDEGDACVGIIDLGDMIHAPLALEIAVTMGEFLVDDVASLDVLPELLAGYTSAQPLEHADVNVLYDLIAARIAIGVLIQTWRERNSGVGAGVNVGTSANSLEEMSAKALDALTSLGKGRLTQQWLDAAGTGAGAAAGGARADHVKRSAPHGDVPPADLLLRRRMALGANAELSYDRPLHVVRGEGVWVYTADGERLLDVYNNVPHVGHAHPVVVAAIAEQAKRIASNTRYLDERIIEYVERLTATLPPDLDTCLFVNSGSEANDIAWRIAKSHTGHDGALVMTHAYHGITDAITALSPAICAKVPRHVEQLAAPNAARRAPSAAGHGPASRSATPSTVEADAAAAEGDVTAAMARLAGSGFKPAALMIDSALTSSGVYDPSPSWVAPIAAAVRKAGALVIADEVQFGLGRSGSDFWGFARRGYHPDIVTLGKPVGNGYPLGVVITRRSILEKFQRDTGFFSTFGGNPVAGAAGLAVLDVLQQEQLVDNARTTGNYFIEKLRDLATKYDVVRDVRGCGLMIGVEVTDRTLTKHLVNSLRDRGVLIGSEGPMGNVLKLRPPMPFRPEHVDFVMDALTAVLSAAHP
ncbi:MAG TPA: aminotransferase class III-fold pyridoxal phosphate-dependent enzyme [Steroidobacteraceae bacterium]|nr:aminotransferase class III-fold pyridoxal phosphate-dependent enzyme [Steroidobacteraceae bacterium]